MEDYRKIAIELGQTLIDKAPETREDVERMLPELKESEDDVIRKELLNYLYDVHDDDEERARWIAWIEEQANHANFRNKIQIGDKVTKNEDGVLVNLSQLKRVAKKDEQILANSAKTCKDEQKPTDVRTTGYWHVEDVEQKPAKVEPKFKIGDRVIGIVSGMQYYITEVCDDYYYTESGCTIMFYAQDNFELYKQKPAEWSKEDERIKHNILRYITDAEIGTRVNSDCTAEARNWLDSLKERVQLKQEWSEEDKSKINDVIVALSECANGNIPYIIPSILLERVDWLKSLRPPYYCDNCKLKKSIQGWKPSDEQIECLSKHIEYERRWTSSHALNVLSELLEQLKKLK